jgi:hypothetical protein
MKLALLTLNFSWQVASEIGTARLREKTMAFTSTVKYGTVFLVEVFLF